MTVREENPTLQRRTVHSKCPTRPLGRAPWHAAGGLADLPLEANCSAVIRRPPSVDAYSFSPVPAHRRIRRTPLPQGWPSNENFFATAASTGGPSIRCARRREASSSNAPISADSCPPAPPSFVVGLATAHWNSPRGRAPGPNERTSPGLAAAGVLSRLPRALRRRRRNVPALRARHAGLQSQTSRAVSTTRSSFRHWSSCESAFPWCVLEKPHCGDRHRRSSGT